MLINVQGNAPQPKRLSKSTATEAQYLTVREMLRSGPKNTMELRRAGVMMPAARIKEMNERHGYVIPRIALINLWDEWGYKHTRIAVYEMKQEPNGATSNG